MPNILKQTKFVTFFFLLEHPNQKGQCEGFTNLKIIGMDLSMGWRTPPSKSGVGP